MNPGPGPNARWLAALLTAGLLACGPQRTASPAIPCDGCVLALKCTFSPSGSDIVSGDAFLYVLRDPSGASYGVVHGLAAVDEPLTSAELGARGDLPVLEARRIRSELEWTERAGEELVTNWIGEWSRAVVGERYLAFGGSHLEAQAYPPCVAHEAMTEG